MPRSSLTFAVAFAMAACTGKPSDHAPTAKDSQATYQYAGCSNEDRGCPPRFQTLICAVRTIASKYDRCSNDEDCAQAALSPKCSGIGACAPYFVAGEFKTRFEGEAQLEIDRYCPESGAVCGMTQDGCMNEGGNRFLLPYYGVAIPC